MADNNTSQSAETNLSSAITTENSKTVVTEGQAKVYFASAQDVFYNPVQQFNRDISIATLRLFALKHLKEKDKSFDQETFLKPGEKYENGISVLEALAASGLRSIRYAKEVGGLKNIVTNDLSASAVESITTNSKMNQTDHLITPNHGDASVLMYQHKRKAQFECVDIDPYGTPSPFIDAAVQCVADGGLLMVTATDMAILCGNVPETCFAKYGSVSLKTKACHEMALRILLQSIASSAARYGRYIHPLVSISVDFYVRLFMLVFTGKKECKSTATKLSMAYQCVNCHTVNWQPMMKTTDVGSHFGRASGPPTSSECEHCHSRLNLGGPFFTDPIHDLDFVQSLLTSLDNPELGELQTEKRIRGILSVIQEELPEIPLYYGLDATASLLKLSVPPMMDFRSAILNAGYRVSLSHCYPSSIKTDAPPSVIWDLFQGAAKRQYPDRTWPRPLPEKPSAADYLLNRTVKVVADFSAHPEANPNSRRQKLVRFQANPEKNWGPKAKAKSSLRVNLGKGQGKKRRLDDLNTNE